jgi:predicted dehydrogenase
MKSVAIIGCGRISEKHIEAVVKNSDVLNLSGVCDPRIERAQKRVADYRYALPDNDAKVYSDYREMLFHHKPDIVTIATESGKHAGIAIECLNAGVHVIVEKPMALSTRDADAMIAAAKKAEKKLAVCFQNRYNLPVQRLRIAREAGRFGRILHGMVQVRWNRNVNYYNEATWRGTWEQDGGTLMNQCTHGIDLLQWMMGEDAVRVQAQTRRFLRPIQAEDFGAAIVEFESGSVGIIEGSADVFPTNLNETLSIFGESGTVVIGGLAVNKIKTWRFEDADMLGDREENVLNPDEKDPPTVYGFGHAALFRDVVMSIESGQDPMISGMEGKKALEIILAIYKSQRTGLPVDLPVYFSTEAMKGIW